MKALQLTRFAAHIDGGPRFCPVDLHLAPGETVALLGPSGAGKSSLLRAIAGLVPATGTIVIGTHDLSHVPAEQRRAVYLHQTPRLFPHLDVAGNVAFPMRLRGLAQSMIEATTAQMLERVRMSALAHRAVGTLSGGEQQRVALARALAATPDLLLLDEPFAALDPALRAEVRDALIALRDPAPPTTILVTHDAEEAAALATRVAVMLDGRVVQVSSPRELFDAPASIAVARFLGVDNVWTIGEAASIDPTLAEGAVGATHLAASASTVTATRDASGLHVVGRVRETRVGQRVEGATLGVGWVATARGGLEVGATVTLATESDRVLRYDGSGNLMGGC